MCANMTAVSEKSDIRMTDARLFLLRKLNLQPSIR